MQDFSIDRGRQVPIYEYRCNACGEELEKIQKFSDAPLTDCPQCKQAALVKLVSASSFRLKGSGWYETDFKTGNKKNGVSENKDESSTNTDTAKADTKKSSGNEKKESVKKESTKKESGNNKK